MKKKYESELIKSCEFCRFSSEITVTGEMLCEKKGVVVRDACCRKFVYDPLKRRPRKAPAIPVPEDLGEEI